MAEFHQRAFENSIGDLPLRTTVAIAVRAAMRVLPTLSVRKGRVSEAFWYWSQDRRVENALAIFRAHQTAICVAAGLLDCTNPSVSEWADSARVLASNDAYRAANEFPHARWPFGAHFTTDPSSWSAAAFSAAAYAGVAPCAACLGAAVAPTASSSIVAGQTAAYAAVAAAATGFDAAYIDSLNQDLVTLHAAGVPKGTMAVLLDQPLWPGGMLAELSDLWTQCEEDLMNLNAGFKICIEWYRDRLHGRPLQADDEWATVMSPATAWLRSRNAR